jgi:hypothetical protein
MKAFQEPNRLFWERFQITECCCGMEDVAMLLFYLPIIIFEAMFEAKKNERKAGEVHGDRIARLLRLSSQTRSASPQTSRFLSGTDR